MLSQRHYSDSVDGGGEPTKRISMDHDEDGTAAVSTAEAAEAAAVEVEEASDQVNEHVPTPPREAFPDMASEGGTTTTSSSNKSTTAATVRSFVTAVASVNSSSESPPREQQWQSPKSTVKPSTTVEDNKDDVMGPDRDPSNDGEQPEGLDDEPDGTATSSTGSHEDDTTLALLRYTRCIGSAASTQDESLNSTCSVLGQVRLTPETCEDSPPLTEAANGSSNTPVMALHPNLWRDEPIPVAVLGLANGSLRVVHLPSGLTVPVVTETSCTCLRVREATESAAPVTAVAVDATGTILAATDAQGMCTVFEVKYGLRMRPIESASVGAQASSSSSSAVPTAVTAPVTSEARTTIPATPSPTSRRPRRNLFNSLLTALTGQQETLDRSQHAPVATTAATHEDDDDHASPPNDPATSTPVPTLVMVAVTMHRIVYPARSFGPPTCLALDPAFRRRREKSLLVGFADGRLLLTKRGFVFARRNDVLLYQGIPEKRSGGNSGVEAVVWRGNFAAWVDATGVRIMDAENFTRIAHIDRPSGARYVAKTWY
jgi:hypothetical protein